MPPLLGALLLIASMLGCESETVDTGVSCSTDSECLSLLPDDKCSATAQCVSGVCQVSLEPRICDGGSACAPSMCDPDTGACVETPLADGASCNDSNLCTVEDTCQAGVCGGAPKCQGDGPCTQGACNPVTGSCTVENVANFTVCDDESVCTNNDVCVNGACTGQPVACTDADDDPCTSVSCDPVTGCGVVNAADDTACDDGDPCTLNDTCQSGQCTAGASPCDGVDTTCVTATCNTDTGACDTTPKDDDTPCDDADACTTGDRCVGGLCKPAGPTCPPGDNPCVVVECNTANGQCTPKPQFGTLCDDGQLCTTGDRCDVSGNCAGDPVECAPSDEPCGVAVCDPTSGNCVDVPEIPGTPCEDGDPCTTGETCGPQGCVGGPLCEDDGNSCTVESCSETGVCETTVLDDGASCDDGNPCTGDGTCSDGQCAAGTPAQCDDDGDPCTVASCTPSGGCQHLPVPDGASCDDGDVCTTGETCTSGTCGDGGPTVCDPDDDPCTTAVCTTGSGCEQVAVEEGGPCDDGDACTESESCQSGQCLGSLVECTTDALCQIPSCDAATGCTTVPQLDGIACDDGDACTASSVCQSGTCTAGLTVQCPAPADPCLVAFCDPDTGQCATAPTTDGTSCSDDNPCTVGDSCVAGACTSGAPFDCGVNSDPCADTVCNPTNGLCESLPRDDGAPCQADSLCFSSGTCQGGACDAEPTVVCPAPTDPCLVALCDAATGTCGTAPGNDGAACDPADPCFTAGVCSNGTCGGTVAAECPDDGDSCTTEFCDPGVGCSSTPADDGTGCTDGNPCSDETTCLAGTCQGGVTLPCPDDGLPCTSDTCVAGIGCIYPPEDDGAACDDGNACTGPDTCIAGQCAGIDASDCPAGGTTCQPNQCDPATGGCGPAPAPDGTACTDGNPCTLDDACSAGGCVGQLVGCADDGNPCTIAQCDPALGACVTTSAAPGLGCDDGSPCTTDDVCDGEGLCAGTPVSCEDPDEPCRVNLCNPSTGQCQVQVASNGTACEDDNLCTVGDVCLQGFCVAGSTPKCVATGPCFQAQCNALNGDCSQTARPDGAFCDDANACTLSETCQNAVCTPASTVPCPDDGEACTVEACDPQTGACSASTLANNSACNDGDACTLQDRCQNGTCTGAPVVCPASGEPCRINQCTAGTCALVDLGDGDPCDDENECTEADTCAAGSCNGDPVVCPPSADECQQEVCNPLVGCELEDANEGQSCLSNVCAVNTVCVSGSCSGGQPLQCPQGAPCTQPACTQETGCTTAQAPNGTACDDGDPCATDGACVAGDCVGSPVTCPTAGPCEVAFCDPVLGCTTSPAEDGAACDDGNPCTSDDVCAAGSCEAGPAVTCTGTTCRPAVCDPATGGCVQSNADDGLACDDGNPCTEDSVCASGQCTGGAAVVCVQPDNPCEVALCTAFGGGCAVYPRPDGSACDDDSLCTTEDRCVSAECLGRHTVACASPDECLVYRCDPESGGCEPELSADGGPCDDGDPCTAADHCALGVCTSGDASPGCCAVDADCDDGSVCSIDTCDAGVCRYAHADLPACIGRVVVAGQQDAELTVLDLETLQAVPESPVPVLGSVTSLATSRRGQLVFASVPDSPLDTILTTDPFVPDAAAPEPTGAASGGEWVTVDEGADILAVVHADGTVETWWADDATFRAAGPVLPPFPGRPGLDEWASRLFVPTRLGQMGVVDLGPTEVVPMTPWAVTGKPVGAAVDVEREQIFLADPQKLGLRVVGLHHGAGLAGDALTGFGAPAGMAVDVQRNRLYAAFPSAEVLRVFELDTLLPATPPAVAISPGPVAVAVDELTGRIFVVSGTGQALHVLTPDTLEPVAGSPATVAAGPVDVAVVWAHVGPVIITEALAIPSAAPAGEWIELHNPGSVAIDVDGWSLTTSLGVATISGLDPIEPGAYVVVCRDASAATVSCDGSAAGLDLDDSGTDVTLSRPDGRVIDAAAITTPLQPGVSLQLRHPGFNGARRFSWTTDVPTPGSAL